MKDGFPFDINRPWGGFRQFTKNNPCTVKILTVKPNEILSLQSHSHRFEFEHVVFGEGFLQIGEKRFNLKEGDEYKIPIGVKHRFSAGKAGLVILEISFGDFDEEDITRYEDKYGRVK